MKNLDTNLEILKKLYSYQQYIQACERGIQIYRPKLFLNEYKKAEEDLKKPAKHTVAKFQDGKCILCGNSIPKNTEGDHLIAKINGGSDYEFNKVPICKSCNSSKKDKDLLEWWFSKGKTLTELDSYVLSIYLKNEYKFLEKKNELNKPSYPHLEIAWLHAQKILNYFFKRYKNLGVKEYVEQDETILEKRKEIVNFLLKNDLYVDPKTLEFLIFKGKKYVQKNMNEISNKINTQIEKNIEQVEAKA